MASMICASSLGYLSFKRTNRSNNGVGTISACGVKAMLVEKPLRGTLQCEGRKESVERETNRAQGFKWSVWKTGKCKLPSDWQVDQLVYVEEGEVRVVPESSDWFTRFVAGDLVRYPKWLEADLYFSGPYQERYSFGAYGDD